ncbi:MAG: NADH-quinone oxidoreductase subunit N, partial [Pseudonocardiaceae bacterium]
MSMLASSLAAGHQVSTVAVDHAAVAPLYVLAATAVLVFVADLFVTRFRPLVLAGATAIGVITAAVTALTVTGEGRRSSFCVPGGRLASGVSVGPDCSYVTGYASTALTVATCAVAVVVLLLSIPLLADRNETAGEYCFLLLCSVVGVVVLVGARDVLTLIVATEALTLPLYVLLALGRARNGIVSATTFFTVSVVSTAITLLGASLLYAQLGVVHFHQLSVLLARDVADEPLLYVSMTLLLAGLLFKLAAVPFHGWAAGSYDAAPLPIVAYLSTISKLGGVAAVLLVALGVLGSQLPQLAVVLAVVAVASMTLGNLAALAQLRLSRLIAWSTIAQLGYVLAPLGALVYAVSGSGAVNRGEVGELVAGSFGYLALYLLVTLGVLAVLTAVRLPHDDGGTLSRLEGLAYRRPWLCGALLFGLGGLAGLPPAFAGLFGKLAVL